MIDLDRAGCRNASGLSLRLVVFWGIIGCNAPETYRPEHLDALPAPPAPQAPVDGPSVGGGGGSGGEGTGGEPFGSGGAGGSGTGGSGGGNSMDASASDVPSSSGGSTGAVDASNGSGGDAGAAEAAPDGGGNAGLVGYWRLDEGKSPIADSSGNGNSGTLFNSPAWTPGPTLNFPNANALVLDGTNQYASLGNPTVLNFAGQITMAAWVKATSSTGAQDILAHGFDANTEVFLRVANGKYEVGSWVNSVSYYTNYSVPAGDIGTWVHLAGVYDGTTWRLYRNGVQVSSAAQATGAVTVTVNWAIGASGDGTSRRFAGAIDDVRIYKRALSATEIADLNRGSP